MIRHSMGLALLACAAWLLVLPPPLSAPLAAADGPAKKISFDDIKLDLKKDEPFDREKHLTDEVAKLDGQKISVRGWIHPNVFTQKGIRKFVLVRDNQECCFGPGAALHDCIYVTMAAGKSTDFTTRPITVEGVFRIEDVPGLDGRQAAIYQMTAHSAK